VASKEVRRPQIELDKQVSPTAFRPIFERLPGNLGLPCDHQKWQELQSKKRSK
jgi:hypothetical protein